MRRFTLIGFVFVLMGSIVVAQDAKDGAKDSGEKKAEPKWHMSGLIIKDVKEVPYVLSGQSKTTFAKMGDTLNEIFFPLLEQAEKNGMHVHSPVYFAYDGASKDRDKPFQILTGFPVHDDDKPFGKFKIRKLPAFRAATVYYTGPTSGIGEAYPKLFQSIFAKGLTPTGHHREVYMFWEGEQSPRNVIEIQIGIK